MSYDDDIIEVSKMSMLCRGRILHEVSQLEIMIDLYLANHFCDKEYQKKDFLKYVMNSKVVIFENKRVLLKKIVEANEKEFLKTIPNWYADLGRIRDIRNAFAHHQVDITQEGIELGKQNKSIVMLDSSKERSEHKTSDIEKILKEIVALKNEIAKAV